MWGRGHVQKECSCWVSYCFLLFDPPGRSSSSHELLSESLSCARSRAVLRVECSGVFCLNRYHARVVRSITRVQRCVLSGSLCLWCQPLAAPGVYGVEGGVRSLGSEGGGRREAGGGRRTRQCRAGDLGPAGVVAMVTAEEEEEEDFIRRVSLHLLAGFIAFIRIKEI